MKKIFLACFFVFIFQSSLFSQTYEYHIITVVESIIPGGLGRSRMISVTEKRDHQEFTIDHGEKTRVKEKQYG